MEISDQTTTALGTPSTTPEEKEKIIEKKVINPKFILASNKRYKNLVNCYKCNFDDCQLIFKSHKELITHQNTHEKKYNCTVNGCNKSFKDKTIKTKALGYLLEAISNSFLLLEEDLSPTIMIKSISSSSFKSASCLKRDAGHISFSILTFGKWDNISL